MLVTNNWANNGDSFAFANVTSKLRTKAASRNCAEQEIMQNRGVCVVLLVFTTAEVRDRVTEGRAVFCQVLCIFHWQGGDGSAGSSRCDNESQTSTVGAGKKSAVKTNHPVRTRAVRRTCFSYKRAEFPTPRSHSVYFRCERAHSLCLFSYWLGRIFYYPAAAAWVLSARREFPSRRNDDDKGCSIFISCIYIWIQSFWQQRPPSSTFAQGDSRNWGVFLLGAK